MNASALLTAQGWRGKGHSLHKTDDSVGLAKPLLLNRKDNTRGIGATQHFTSDQWWMNAFDEQLQGLDTTKKGKVVQTVTTGKLNAIEGPSLGKYSLYTTFVRGGFLEGTLEALNKDKKSDDDGDDDDSATSDSDSDPAEKTKTKTETQKAKESKETKETKDERRARKEAKRLRREARAQRKLRKAKRSKSKSDSSDDTDEEKKRRRARKEEKRRRRKEREGK